MDYVSFKLIYVYFVHRTDPHLSIRQSFLLENFPYNLSTIGCHNVWMENGNFNWFSRWKKKRRETTTVQYNYTQTQTHTHIHTHTDTQLEMNIQFPTVDCRWNIFVFSSFVYFSVWAFFHILRHWFRSCGGNRCHLEQSNSIAINHIISNTYFCIVHTT